MEPLDGATLHAAIKAHRGSRRSLAQKLGLSERTLYRRIQNLPATK
jgi:DNA-binding NtrC family response regulator